MKIKATLEGPTVDAVMDAVMGTLAICGECPTLVGIVATDDGDVLAEHPKHAMWDGKNVTSLKTERCPASGAKVTPMRPNFDEFAITFDVPDDADLAMVERELNEPTPRTGRWRVTADVGT